ncbi:MAG: bifunctional (p)ppGpp synthetase/guanosine-3',5'-bis(diphosphate) 3'-pyrophosphohydrolase [Prevotella sp.]|jgi:GTP pyrophosphokinase|nr:bifunctional (p)ppGpp synthetase/guanosine-3',5'-bis(diphosphate) 3'-pyrophosphohydrolase [Prevotella sp.]
MTDKEMIDEAYARLLRSYTNSNHRKKVDIIQKAYNFALKAHEGDYRSSGEPYIMHPLAVATIISEEMGLGSTSICAALLHDVLDGTDYTIDDIENIFGKKIALIVDGLTKIAGGIFGDKASEQAENFKKLLLTMSEDIRVILIKICDRLDNMRHLDKQPEAKRYKISGETLYIYAPLANRLGLNTIKTELEDLAFKYEHPEEYDAIEKNLAHTKEKREELFDKFTRPIRESLDDMGIQYTIKARIKSPFSIWNKMQKKHVSFDEIYDILAVRIIFTPRTDTDEENECFNIYVALCKLYKSHPDRLRDWLSHPKANGYKALHVTLMSNQGRWIEVQIRSRKMDEIAEQGFAAHWKYKSDSDTEKVAEDELNGWLQTIKEILDDPQPDAMDFLDAIKLNLFASEIFVFSPKGDIITMPANCTALDYAFQIHTFLGAHCIGAKVNHKLVPLSHELKSGDQIEIITNNSQKVQPAWLNFVTTAKARTKLQTLLRKQDREYAKKGEETLQVWLEQNGLTLSTSNLDKLTEAHRMKHHDQLFIAIAKGDIVLGQKDIDYIYYGAKGADNAKKRKGWRRYIPFVRSMKKAVVKGHEYLTVGKDFDKTQIIEITDENISKYVFPKCCQPIPGDEIIAYVNKKNQIEIHQRSCPEAARLQSSFGSNILVAKWSMSGSMEFRATLALRGIDRKGIIRDVSLVLAGTFDIDIHRMSTLSDDGIFNSEIELKVKDSIALGEVEEQLRQIDGMQSVHRI